MTAVLRSNAYSATMTAAPTPAAPAALIASADQLLKAQAAAADHQALLTEQHLLMLGITKLQPAWSTLPLGPYPATADEPLAPPGACPSGTYASPIAGGYDCVSGAAPPALQYARTGDPSFVLLSASTISAAQRNEPAAVAQGLVDQAAARTPQLSGLFWIGLACLGAGIYVYRKR